MGEESKSHDVSQLCKGHWMYCCQHWHTGFSGKKETTMKLSGRRSSELSYIELDQSDWSFKWSIVCRKSRSSLGNSTAASVVHVLRSIFIFFSWVFDKCFTNLSSC